MQKNKIQHVKPKPKIKIHTCALYNVHHRLQTDVSLAHENKIMYM